MSKTTDEKREAKIKEIMELTKQRDGINARLNFLTGIVESSNTTASNPVPPSEFSWMKEVSALFTEHNQLRILQATALLQKKYPQYQIDRSKVHGAIAYLAKKGFLKKEEERGLFTLKNQEN